MSGPNAPAGGAPPEIPEPERNPLRRIAKDLAAIRAGVTVLASLAVLALLDLGASVFITLFSSALLAFALEPPVRILCRRTGMKRQYAGGIVVFLFIAMFYGAFYLVYLRVADFMTDIPEIAEQIRSAPLVEKLTEKTRELRDLLWEAGRRMSSEPPQLRGGPPQTIVQDGESVTSFLLHGLGSLTGIVFSLSFIPFLAYFILADREPLQRRFRELFSPEHRGTVTRILEDIERMMRTYLLGNLMIAGMLSVATSLVFLLAGLPYPVVLGVSSGMVSIVPYLGLVLALLPALIVGMVAFHSAAPLVLILLSVTAFHLIAVNYLAPRFVGAGLHMNATASTTSLLIFAWLWGGVGLLLGIPILAILRCILENIPSTRRLGMWLGN